MLKYAKNYQKQCALLLRVLPLIAKEPELALKGGTAINFFIQNLPRLSIDIDLVYLPISPRETALRSIVKIFERLIETIQRMIGGTQVSFDQHQIESFPRMFISSRDALIKLEISPVFRVLPVAQYDMLKNPWYFSC